MENKQKTFKFRILKDFEQDISADNWIKAEINYELWEKWSDHNYQNFRKLREVNFDGSLNIPCYDIDECQECWMLSRDHFNDFLAFAFEDWQ